MNIRLALITLLVALIPQAHNQTAPAPPSPAQPTTTQPTRSQPTTTLRIHYHRFDGRYEGWNVWAWAHAPKSLEGKAFEFTESDEYGKIVNIEIPGSHSELGFIVRKGNWEAKDVSADRFVSVPTTGANAGKAEIWVLEGQTAIKSAQAEIDLTPTITAAFLDRSDMVQAALTLPFDPTPKDALAKLRFTIDGQLIGITRITAARPNEVGGPTTLLSIQLERMVKPDEISRAMRLELKNYRPTTVFARGALEERPYWYSGSDLGARWSETSTAFRTWSPVASEVTLLLYRQLNGRQPHGEPERSVPMEQGSNGSWTTTVSGNLHGFYYRYRFVSYGETRFAPDIYGIAASRDSRFSMVVDPAQTNPSGWLTDTPPHHSQPTDAILYEMHVRDFTIDPSSNVRAEWRGKYLGLTEEGLRGPNGIKTGLDHLVELGITDIHLMPIQDFNPANSEIYNWGYETTLFNVPEAQYSTNPDDPIATIRELKTMIQTLHRHRLRLVMDVVYNHVMPASGADNPFEQTVPFYYFRTDERGVMLNESGVGNALHDERPMARKFVRDSVLYWVREYHVDGFRFDLLGMFSKATVRDLEQALHGERADLLIYGEPWTGGGPIRFGKGDQAGMHLAVFNDNYRDALRGDTRSSKPGFISGSLNVNTNLIKRGLLGSFHWGGVLEDFTTSPIETINYVSAHDDLSLWDKVAKSMSDADYTLHARAVKLAGAAVLLAQGIPFLEGGVEIGRTKDGNENSYNAGDSVNRFDWVRAAEFQDVYTYYRGLISLRRNHPVFRIADPETVRRVLHFLPDHAGSEHVVATLLDGSVVDDPWRQVLVVFNGARTSGHINLPTGEWNIAVDPHNAMETTNPQTTHGHVVLEPLSAYVFYSS